MSDLVMDKTYDEIPEEVLRANEELFRLNLELHNPEVAEWLHSEAAVETLKELLINVPGFGSIH